MITNEWQRWLAENEFLAVDEELIVQRMVDEGMSGPSVRSELSRLRSDPYYSAAVWIAQKLRKIESLLAAKRKLAATEQTLIVDRIKGLTATQFFLDYYASNRPVIIEGFCSQWAACRKWSPEYLSSLYGDVEVDVSQKRMTEPHRRGYVHTNSVVRMTIREYLTLIETESNATDYYLTANNGALDLPALSGLLKDIEAVPEFLDESAWQKRVFLWVGPSGTVTPLHHDNINIVMAQFYGTKLFRLIPPEDTPLLYNERGVYSSVDLEAPDYERYPLFREARIFEVHLSPGDLLFIPVGWWHHVRSLSTSIGMSFTNFVRPNTFEIFSPSIER